MSKIYPRITLVTPCLNAGTYIKETVLSVIRQKYPNLEYIIRDGGSNDGTIDVLSQFESGISGIVTEPDKGIYDALNKGFCASNGEIMGWLNAGDLLHPNSLFTIGEIFNSYSDVSWVTGIPCNIDEIGRFHESRLKQYWDFEDLRSQEYGAPQQESTFWRRSLWERAGNKLDLSYDLAGDFDLWCRFFEHKNLVTVRAFIGGFRKHGQSLSVREKEKYKSQVNNILERYGSFRKSFLQRSGLKKKKYQMLIYNFDEQVFRLRSAC